MAKYVVRSGGKVHTFNGSKTPSAGKRPRPDQQPGKGPRPTSAKVYQVKRGSIVTNGSGSRIMINGKRVK